MLLYLGAKRSEIGWDPRGMHLRESKGNKTMKYI